MRSKLSATCPLTLPNSQFPKHQKQIGKRLGELEDAAEAADVAILGLMRGGKRRYGAARNSLLQSGDILVLEASPEALDEFRATLGLAFAEREREERVKATGEGLDLVEVVVTAEARIVGKTALSIGLSWRKQTVLMGISRAGHKITSQIRKTQVQAGDILLLLVPKGTGPEVTDWIGALPLADRGLAVTQDSKTWLAIGLFVSRCRCRLCRAASTYRSRLALWWSLTSYSKFCRSQSSMTTSTGLSSSLLGSMIPLGAALENSGGTELLAGALLSFTDAMPAWAILTVLMLVTMTLSDVLNNTATTIVAAPVGIEMARALDVSPDPFLMAVAIAASSAFLTPIGHKNNTLILGPGGYSFGDYWRMGLPLEIIVVTVSIPLILVFWPL